MRRTQVQLDEATYDAVRRKAFEERRSMAAVIRELIARSVGTTPARSRPRRLTEFSFIGERQPDGALRFRRPDGRPLPEVPLPVTVPGDPVQALRARHDAQGLRLHARTGCA